MGQPVACIVKDAVVCESVFNRNVPVGEDEVVHGLGLQHLSGILNLKFLFVFENEDLRFVGGAAAGREVARDGKGMPWVQHAVKHTVGLVCKDAFDEVVASLLAAEPVAVANQTALAVKNEGLRLVEDVTAKLLCEIVLHPHVMIAGEKVDFNACLMQFVQQVEQSEVSFGDHITVLKPEVEDVAQEEKMLDFSFLRLQQLDQQGLTLLAVRIFRRAQVRVGDEEGIALYGNRMVKQHGEKGIRIC